MKKIKQILKRFDALSLRERLLAVLALPVLLGLAFQFFVLDPTAAKSKTLKTQLARQQTEYAELSKLAAEMAVKRPVDRLSKARAERDELQARVDEAQSFIDKATDNAPLARVIRAMVAATPGLNLLSLKTLPVEVFFKPTTPGTAKQDPATPTPTLYRHGVEASIKGRYAALMPYLQGLQRHSNRLFWGSVKLEVAGYPDAILRLTIYTLSDQQEAPLS
ncbi:hypothetical protein [Roseateles violae]|uniref:MSHA biogenesis protein MshJ n=1 Tax=Roseateles violae TaxID=3058042 RepID=A0ABT8DUM8_9BURK|nr:hypothetical protein [Pelomonas sp. PFR6]MDN3921693.1 hypothetical protein [Pelomonas sp. PFR6]